MLTRPKLILPFQIARMTYKLRGSCLERRSMTAEIERPAVIDRRYRRDLGRGFEFFAANAAQLVKPD